MRERALCYVGHNTNCEMEPELEENTVVKKGFSWEIPGLHTEISYLMRKEKWKRQKCSREKKIFQQESSTE